MLAAAILAAGVVALAEAAPQADAARPNIVIFLADDWQADCLGLLGHPVVKTPNLDALCRSGFIFRNAYVAGSHVPAVCLPSRAMIQTGLSYHRDNRVWFTKPRPDLPPTLAETIKAAGYASIRSGKGIMNPNHLDAPFDEHIECQNTILGPHDSMDMRGEGEAASRNADHLVRFIGEHAGTKPLFLYMASDEPHDPQFAPEEFYAMYRPKDMPVPPTFKPLHPFDNGEMTIRDEKMLPWPRTPELVAWRLARYYASVSYWDREVGRVIEALKEAGEFENTIFVVSGDNGLSNGEHGLVGKQNLYENGGMHVPLIFVGPGIPQGDSRSLAHLYDIYPTLCDLAGIPVPDGLDAKSLAPVIQGRQAAVREVLFTTYKNCQKAIRDARWKLIRYPLIDKTQLFDLQADPHELNNLADRPEQAATIERLMREMKEAQAAFGDTDPLAVEHPAAAEWVPPAEARDPAAARCRVRPADTGAALANPGMGWVFHHYDNGLGGYGRQLGPGYDGSEFPGLTVAYLRLAWSHLEPEEGKFAWSILDTPIQRYAAAGKRFAFRFTVMEGSESQGTPAWVRAAGCQGHEVTIGGKTVWEPDYDDPVLLDKLAAFLAAAGRRYDGHDGLEFVDVGTLGIWGEGHPLARTYAVETLERHIALHQRAFPRSLLVAQDDWGFNFRSDKNKSGSLAVMELAAREGLAFRDDTICVYENPKADDNTFLAAPFQPHRPVILEMAHYGHTKKEGTWEGGERYLRAIENYAASYASIHANPRVFLEENAAIIDRINRRLGYRLNLVEAAWPAVVTRSDGLPLEAAWRNVGVATCLPGGHPTWLLRDDQGRLAAALVDDGFDVRELAADPERAAPPVARSCTLPLPPEIPPGTYELRVAVGSASGDGRLLLPLADGDAARSYPLGTVRLD